MNESLIVRDLRTGYGKREVLRGVSFALERGEVTALLGPNGSGKTTLARAVLGLLPAEGSARLLGKEITSVSAGARAKCLAYLSDGSDLTLRLPVIDVIGMGAYPETGAFASPGRFWREEAERLLEDAGLTELAEKDFTTLSGGQKQAVLLLRTLLRKVPLYVLDEPDSALDFTARRRVLAMLKRRVVEAEGAALLLSHDVAGMLNAADRVLLMRDGRLTGDLRPREDPPETISRAIRAAFGDAKVIRTEEGYAVL